MEIQASVGEWAKQEFGRARLGDARRTKRAVVMAACAAASPSGKMTQVFRTTSGLEAAGRFIRNGSIVNEELGASARDATVRRCQRAPFVFVPTDQSALTLADPQGHKNIGSVGTTKTPARGLQVLTAIGVTPDGVPQGLLGQQYWARENRKKKTSMERDALPVADKETQRWLDVMEQAESALADRAFGTVPWYQMDRGADAWPVLLEGVASRGWITVRASWDRHVIDEEEGQQRFLWNQVSRQPVLGDYLLFVPGGHTRTERLARMVLRSCPVLLHLRDKRTKDTFEAPFNAVLAREEGTAPPGEEAIEWLLLTTHSVDGIEEAQLVVFGYSQRWRIEEFHNAWKSGGCCVEDTQLHKSEHVERWATMLASVAMRLVRLSYMARYHSDEPATIELTPFEIQAAQEARDIKPDRKGRVPTIAQAVEWIAREGGYVGKSSGGPPGHRVIALGLSRIAVLARVLARRHNDGKTPGDERDSDGRHQR